jgi:hypothetical protein
LRDACKLTGRTTERRSCSRYYDIDMYSGKPKRFRRLAFSTETDIRQEAKRIYQLGNCMEFGVVHHHHTEAPVKHACQGRITVSISPPLVLHTLRPLPVPPSAFGIVPRNESRQPALRPRKQQPPVRPLSTRRNIRRRVICVYSGTGGVGMCTARVRGFVRSPRPEYIHRMQA